MAKAPKNFCLMATLFGIIMIAVSAKFVSSLECEYYNVTECGLKAGGAGADTEFCKKSQRTITCEEDTSSQKHSCWVAWQRRNDSQDILQFKGCFINNNQCDGEHKCVDKTYGKRSDPSTATVTLFCCCSEDNCNRDFEWDPIPTTTTIRPKAVIQPQRPGVFSLTIVVVVPIMCALFATVAFIFHRRMQKKHFPSSDSGLTDEENILLDKSESNHALSVTLVEMKAQGRFGSVWKASMAGNNNYVAVKILPLREKASWRLEQEVYSLPLMCDSEWVLGFFGARTHTDGDNSQLWLISEYLEYGSLYDYLKGNVLKWNELLKVAITMCHGLAFLHEEIDNGAKGYKSAVAHRDFKSKNVLVRADLTACVADFGLAQIFYPNKPVGTSHGQVGTRRYMAPEVLEGAVSFTRDSFQRIDMYACGLVLWELASRCNAQQGPIGEYRLPFEEFTGQQPSLEEMQDVVVTQRKRPTIRNDWLSHPGMTVLVEAMRDAWDQDAEARISASCIVERLSVLNNKIM
ncbi:Activin receptor type-2A [Orchesella cincta]|uniref:Serine/threonine-protein kinase receptor n=1 Tax=Orchesella cincta TaxID=48709 RepID=A0A1D2MFS0_ORCCI|nr:Activin receptor type-2A [Orchesella cincta]